MKKLLVSLSVLLLAYASFGQNDKFQKGMEKTMTMLDSAKTSEDYTSVAAAFERIGDAEKTRWLPYYYAAFCNIMKGFQDQKVNKDEVATKAEELIAKAEAIEPKNSEIFILKNMASTLHMLVDPQTRWQQYGAKGNEALTMAKQLDPNNPRAYLMEGQGIFGMPVQFGGGKDKAKPVFEKSVSLFEAQKPASSLAPQWGKSSADRMLALCK
ncbi:MAG: hypothetical protein H0U39_03535 [Segetibacter sp.]|nr:hypothetical protein [Segetibacter sp.]